MFEFLNWDEFVTFMNSNFTAALAGAFAGAMAAHKIGSDAKKREQSLIDLRSTNAGIIYATTICSMAINLKGALVKDIHQNFQTEKKRLTEFLENRKIQGSELPRQYEFQADLRTLDMPRFPIEQFAKLVYEKIPIGGRSLAALAHLDGAIDSLRIRIQKRTSLIERFRNLNEDDRANFPFFYFGLPYSIGHVDAEFSDTVESIAHLTDDVIFFSHLLVKDLERYGRKLPTNKISLLTKATTKVHEADFGKAEKEGLLPEENQYANWISGFPSDQN